MTRYAVLIALLLLSLTCFAGEEKKRDKVMMDIPKFLQHQRELREDLESERHAHIDASARHVRGSPSTDGDGSAYRRRPRRTNAPPGGLVSMRRSARPW